MLGSAKRKRFDRSQAAALLPRLRKKLPMIRPCEKPALPPAASRLGSVRSDNHLPVLIAEMATASQEQSQGIAQVSETVAQMEQVTLQNAAMVEEMTAASGSLEEQAQALVQAVGSFKLSEGEQAQAAAVRSAAAPAPRPATAKQRHADHTLASSKLTRLPGRAKAKAAASSSAGDDGDEKDWKEF